jgi:hypothetical protein
MSIAKSIIESIPSVFASVVAGIGLIVTYKMASRQNKINFISNKRRERTDLLIDEIAEYITNAKLFFGKIKFYKPDEKNGYLEIHNELTSAFAILYYKILLKIDDEYKELKQAVKDLYLCVVSAEAEDVQQLGDSIKKVADLAQDMRKTENNRVEADIGIKTKKRKQ